MMAKMVTDTCTQCGRRVWWARTEASGKPMPIDVEPHPAGNVVVASPDRWSTTIVRVLHRHELPDFERWLQRYHAHAAYCGRVLPPHDRPDYPIVDVPGEQLSLL